MTVENFPPASCWHHQGSGSANQPDSKYYNNKDSFKIKGTSSHLEPIESELHLTLGSTVKKIPRTRTDETLLCDLKEGKFHWKLFLDILPCRSQIKFSVQTAARGVGQIYNIRDGCYFANLIKFNMTHLLDPTTVEDDVKFQYSKKLSYYRKS